jgi:LmbE family N-acetylglucosaminyl deacetylase
MSGTPVSAEQLLAPSRHIFLSPHYDDIALSCGGTASRIAEASRRPEVALIFGDHPDPTQPLTEFAESLHRQWGLDAAQVIASRREEEADASNVLGTTAIFLPFRDAIYRGRRYLGDDQLFGAPAENESGLPSEIIEAIGLSRDAAGDVRVYAPLAVGFHVDHQHAFRAGVQLARHGVEVWFYEDLPYGLLPGAVERRIEAIEQPLCPSILVDVSDQWEKKVDAIFAYPSQLSTVFGQYVGIGTSRADVSDAMGAYARGVGNGAFCERFWTLES